MEDVIRKFPSIENCYCGCTLTLGCLVVAWLYAVVSAIFVILFIVLFVMLIVVTVNDDFSGAQAVGIFNLITTIPALLATGGMLGLAILLLLGLYKDDIVKIEIWLFGQIIVLAVYTFLCLVNIIGMFCISTVDYTLGSVIFELIWIGVTVYCIIVVKSYYYEQINLSRRATELEEQPAPEPVPTNNNTM